MDQSLLLSAGGLFDFGATLPLMAIQFLILMVVLDNLLYSPLLTIINERNEFVQINLKKATELVEKADKITMEAEAEVSTAKEVSRRSISEYTKEAKKRFESDTKYINDRFEDAILATITEQRSKQIADIKTLRSENEEKISKLILDILLN
jgi:F-type H+-transporting ATPase subunit b